MRESTSKGLYIALTLLTVVSVAMIGLAGCSREEDSPQPGVSFAEQIVPILRDHCLECHVPGKEGYEESGLDMSTYAGLMKGTKYGSVITPGESISSTLIMLVEGGADPSINMPHGDRPALDPERVQLLRQWVDEGAIDN